MIRFTIRVPAELEYEETLELLKEELQTIFKENLDTIAKCSTDYMLCHTKIDKFGRGRYYDFVIKDAYIHEKED